MKNSYEILGVNPNSSDEEIKTIYKRLAKKYHPDNYATAPKAQQKQAEDKMKEINAAYDAIKSERNRPKPPPIDKGADETKDYLKRQPHQRQQKKPINAIRGTDIHYNLAIKFEEAAFGKQTSIKVSRLETCQHCNGIGGTDFDICPDCHGIGQLSIFDEKIFSHWGSIFDNPNSITTCRRCHGKGKIIKTPCNHCHGSGKVNVTRELAINIPKGIADGMKIKIRGGGNAGDNGGEYGSLFVHITVKPNAIFRRKGSNIYCEMKISFIQAALGTTIDVPTLEGNTVKLDIPAGTQYDDVFKLSGKGFHNPRSDSRGDEFVIIKLTTPKNLSNRQKKLLQKFETTYS